MVDRAIWQDEILRQRDRLEADLVSRQVGIALTCILFGFFLPFWFLFLVYLITLCTEFIQHRLLRDFETNATRSRHTAILANAALGMAVYSLPALFVWQEAEPIIKFAGVLSLVGALLSISVVRSTHLMLGIICGLPPAIGLLWMPFQHLFNPNTTYYAAIAVAGVITLLGYFLSALVQNYRAQAHLIAAIASARQASEAKSRFLSAMSHEVRTPLTAILGNSQLLGEADDPEMIRHHAAAVEGAARAMQTMIDDATDLAAATEGEVRFRPVTAVIRTEVEAVTTLRLPRIASADPVIAVEFADDVPEFARFDPLLLRKCLVHLLTITLSESGPDEAARLRLRCSLAPGRIDRLRITITPDGAEGAQAEGAAAATFAGLGEETLGVALVHGIAKVMGASAAVMRAADGSLVSRIELPFVTVPEPPASGAESVYGHLRALVVDDIATNRFVIVQMLRSLRIDANEARGGADALDRLATHDFDFVLLDMNMPDMDGEATFQAIRAADAPWSRIPVVAVTADAPALKREHYLRLGLDGYIAKPVDKRLLWSEILCAVPPPPPL